MDRRNFLTSTVAMGALAPLSGVQPLLAAQTDKSDSPVALGFDNFSIRAFGWKAPKLIDYAASLKVNVLLMSDLNVYESLDADYLGRIKAQADRHGLTLQAGTGSICPTSSSYNAGKWGKAEDHLKLLVRTAHALGANVARCYLGSRRDRQGDGGIERHIEETIKVCQSARTLCEETGVKIAIENHAGDMQAWELAGLIEAAGKGYVGATMDSGNAAWTLEDPMVNLEILGPYALTAGLRDNAIWETEKGARVMWANMGQGVMDWPRYVKRFKELCPQTPFVLEIISYKWENELKYLEPGFWKAFPKARAHEFARFVALAKAGRKFVLPEGRPTGKSGRSLEQAQQRFDLESSIAYCRDVLGLGR